MRRTKLIIGALIGLLLLGVAAVAALYFVDPSVFRGQLEARASELLGWQFQINGPIRLERSMRPRIIIEDITIGNPSWASSAHFATAEKLGFQVALFPLLRGDLRVLEVSFTGVNLSIEEGPDGTNNYGFGDSQGSKEPGLLTPIERLLIRDVIINHQTADAASGNTRLIRLDVGTFLDSRRGSRARVLPKAYPFPSCSPPVQRRNCPVPKIRGP